MRQMCNYPVTFEIVYYFLVHTLASFSFNISKVLKLYDAYDEKLLTQKESRPY